MNPRIPVLALYLPPAALALLAAAAPLEAQPSGRCEARPAATTCRRSGSRRSPCGWIFTSPAVTRFRRRPEVAIHRA